MCVWRGGGCEGTETVFQSEQFRDQRSGSAGNITVGEYSAQYIAMLLDT